MKTKEIISFIAVFLWVFILLIPMGVLMFKLTIYLASNSFAQWWISIIWVISIPISLSILYLLKLKKEK